MDGCPVRKYPVYVEIVEPVEQRLELAYRQESRGKGAPRDGVGVRDEILGKRVAEDVIKEQVELQEGSVDKVTNRNG